LETFKYIIHALVQHYLQQQTQYGDMFADYNCSVLNILAFIVCC